MSAKISTLIFHLKEQGQTTPIPCYAVPHVGTAHSLCKHAA